MLPGADPDTINIAALHQLIEHREPLSPVARQLNSTPEAVGHVLTLHPANIGPPSTTAALSALAAKLPPEKFTALYRQKRTTLRAIAARYHADRRTVAALAHQYGIDTRHKPRLHEEIDRDWLYTEYVVHRRTLPELAAEKGTTTPNMSRWAHGTASPVDPQAWPAPPPTSTPPKKRNGLRHYCDTYSRLRRTSGTPLFRPSDCRAVRDPLWVPDEGVQRA